MDYCLPTAFAPIKIGVVDIAHKYIGHAFFYRPDSSHPDSTHSHTAELRPGNMLNLFFLDVTATSLLLWIIYKVAGKRRRERFPPGPKPLPFVGNLFDVPHEQEWVTYGRWNDTWGAYDL